MRYRFYLIVIMLLWLRVVPIEAHANLVRSEPSANTRLEVAPDNLTLYFSEPLELNFSQIEIRNAQDEVLDTAPAQLSESDDTILILQMEHIPDGVYTVIWRVVSQTDGHLTQGSFPILIGATTANADTIKLSNYDGIPMISSLIRWINLLSLAWLVGSVAFVSFVWQAPLSNQYPEIEERMNRVTVFAWLCVSVGTSLILLLQAQIVSGDNWLASLNLIPDVITGTRFGALWLIRVFLWLIFGIVLWNNSGQGKIRHTILIVLGAGILITQGLFSHASGTVDAFPSILADFFHLLAMSFWIGGLLQFLYIIPPMRSYVSDLAVLVAHFSNLARFSVAILVSTGVYAAWLHIGSVEALINTHYGQAMLLKLVLFLPLLVIGAINLFLTNRGLKNGKQIWGQRLQFLVAVEVLLTIGMMGAVGVMTAIAPARTTFATQELVSSVPESDPYFEMAFDDEMMIHFTIEPGTVGENTFYVDLFDVDHNTVIDDASLIRLRFEKEEDHLGESELRPVLQNNGRYVVDGANLSVAGDWRIRMTIQRPNEFDTVLDFEPTIRFAEAPIIPDFDPSPSKNNRSLALLLMGLTGMMIACISLTLQRPLRFNLLMLIKISLIGSSLLILLAGLRLSALSS